MISGSFAKRALQGYYPLIDKYIKRETSKSRERPQE